MTVANLLISLSVKESWKSFSIWWSYGQECSDLFFTRILFLLILCDYVEVFDANIILNNAVYGHLAESQLAELLVNSLAVKSTRW